MAKYEIDFPRHMNDYPLFVYFPVDMIIVAFTGFFLGFWIISLWFNILLSLVLSLALGVYSYFKYKEYKKNTAPGVLFHIMYILGFISYHPHEKHEELTNLDIDSFFAAGYETEFRD